MENFSRIVDMTLIILKYFHQIFCFYDYFYFLIMENFNKYCTQARYFTCFSDEHKMETEFKLIFASFPSNIDIVDNFLSIFYVDTTLCLKMLVGVYDGNLSLLVMDNVKNKLWFQTVFNMIRVWHVAWTSYFFIRSNDEMEKYQ